MPERPVELAGENALTQEEARVLLCGSAWEGFTLEEQETYLSARRKIAAARERAHRLRLVTGNHSYDLSPAHRKLLKLIARNGERPAGLRNEREVELARDLAALDLVEIGPLGARITDAGQGEAA